MHINNEPPKRGFRVEVFRCVLSFYCKMQSEANLRKLFKLQNIRYYLFTAVLQVEILTSFRLSVPLR